ncbi:hypothetical protein Tco_0254897 [Tanacetum coccineum]
MLILRTSAQVDQESQIKMIHVKEMMQDNDLKNSKSKDKGSRSRSQSMNEQSHYKQDKTKTRQSINVKSHILNVIGVQIFYNRVNEALKEAIDYAVKGRLRKLSAEKAWVAIKKLAQYEDEGWSDPIIPEEGNLDYENLNIEHLLGVMEYKVDALIKNAISLMGRSECIFRITSNEMYQFPPEPSHQKEFESIVTNFILDQEERVKQLKEYMEVIMGDFMQLSSEVIRRLYLMRRSLEILRKFHWMTLGGRSIQLSHVSSPFLSKPGEY